ncbi:tetratricopeptide repeat protein [Flavobacterium luteum]|uniref:Tetratricopeptide repeat protein n=1 Tax=Flavobacterium luteum TaxID=2026654 RepID=A0A7J5AET7_9FLAO|nr:tetratricopeptide repeat protein [Flavobacterium luteum]KAB1156003.1 tetratricopeptide repeat protein [Flavobacterium luteum]
MKKAVLYSLLFFSLATFAQEKDPNLPKGNQEFEDKNYTEAEADYRISQSKIPKSELASYNLGNAIYRQNQSSEAKYSFLKAIENSKTRAQKHQAFHNLGNVFMNEKKYSQAVEAYKNALRNNPSDEETRYNYALAKKMLKENPPKKDDKKKDKDKKDKDKKDKDKKDDKKDGDKDKKDGDKDKKDGDKDKKDDKKEGDKDKKEDKGNEKPNQKPQPKPGGISKERLQNLMDAVNNEEKKVQEKVNAQKVKGKPVQTEKDW